MRIFAIADLHLSFGTPGKKMDIFGPEWEDHPKKMASYWDAMVAPEDLVLIPGDISWAMKIEDALPDLAWIDARPGTKVLIRGNHDYWWDTIAKVRRVLPPSIRAIGNDSIAVGSVALAGARLWDTSEYSFRSYIAIRENKAQKKNGVQEKITQEDEKIFAREVGRLQMSLEAMAKGCPTKIVLTHYPPIAADLADSQVSKLLERYGVNYVVFGHLHSLLPNQKMFGVKGGIHYHLVSADYLQFKLLQIL